MTAPRRLRPALISTWTVADAVPTLTTPVISGTAQEGQVLTATAAAANDADAAVTYHWQANSRSGFVNLTGENSLNHTVTEADEGATLRIVATLDRPRWQRHQHAERGDERGHRHHAWPSPRRPRSAARRRRARC